MFTPYPDDLVPRAPRKEDPADKRMGSFVQTVRDSFPVFLEKVKKGDLVLIGYPDDRGVERNGGRTGAFAAPDRIRHWFYKMTPSYRLKTDPQIWDLGNLKSWSLDLADAHTLARECVRELRKKGARIVTLGGGHDWAYPDFVEFGEAFEGRPAKVINVDSHLDMRPDPQDPGLLGHSGTPFRRILNSGSRRVPEISVIGLQEHCNAKSHIEWAHDRRVSTLFNEEVPENLERRWPLVEERLQLKDAKAAFGLSIDVDVFPQFMAPGSSAPQPLGVDPRLVIKMVQILGTRVEHLGLYEYNPRFDEDERTARLLALLLHNFVTTLHT
jgi:formiminoglutamase